VDVNQIQGGVARVEEFVGRVGFNDEYVASCGIELRIASGEFGSASASYPSFRIWVVMQRWTRVTRCIGYKEEGCWEIVEFAFKFD
jgi:hypothetical protein